MNHPLLLTLVTLTALASSAPEGGAQVAVDSRPAWSVSSSPDPISGRTSPRPERPGRPVAPQDPATKSFSGTVVGATIGSALGLVGGALLGFGLSDGEITSGAAVLTLGGSVIGAGIGGGIASGRGDLAFVGSLLGSALGGGFVAAAEPEGFAALISYSAIQGLTTALFAGR